MSIKVQHLFGFARLRNYFHPLGLAVWLCCVPSVATAQGFLGTDFVTGTADGATASGASTAVGSGATATGVASDAFGINSMATGFNSSAYAGVASAEFSTAIGVTSTASGKGSTTIGQSSVASGANSTATGQNSAASGDFSTANGSLSTASGLQSTAIGAASSATKFDSTAVGINSTASGETSTAVGAQATAGFVNSSAIGFGATTTRDNQVVLGTASNTYTAPGIASAASRAAQSGPKGVVTSDLNGNLATANVNSIVTSSSAFQDLQHQSHINSEGAAMAIAMGGGTTILPDNKVMAVSTNWGTFNGQGALGFSGVARVSDNWYANGGVGVGTGFGSTGGRAGMTWAW
jgi:hypothetical protein